jgi:hypothetical protein
VLFVIVERFPGLCFLIALQAKAALVKSLVQKLNKWELPRGLDATGNVLLP